MNLKKKLKNTILIGTLLSFVGIAGCLPKVPKGYQRQYYGPYQGKVEAPIHGGHRLDKNYDGKVDSQYRGRKDVFIRERDQYNREKIYLDPKLEK